MEVSNSEGKLQAKFCCFLPYIILNMVSFVYVQLLLWVACLITFCASVVTLSFCFTFSDNSIWSSDRRSSIFVLHLLVQYIYGAQTENCYLKYNFATNGTFCVNLLYGYLEPKAYFTGSAIQYSMFNGAVRMTCIIFWALDTWSHPRDCSWIFFS